MSPSPLSPRLLKGAIVAIDPATSKQTTIAFQYNPETLSRTLTPQTPNGDKTQRAEVLRFTGAPTETFSSWTPVPRRQWVMQATSRPHSP